MNTTLSGWLLDVYPDLKGGLALWLIEDAGAARGRRIRLRQPFPVVFYAAGPDERLRALWKYLRSQEIPVELERAERRDLFQPHPVTVMRIQVDDPARQPALLARLASAFPDLTWYDADLAISLRHAAVYGTFPLAKVRAVVDERLAVHSLSVLDSPWDLDPPAAPLRIMRLEPDCDPHHTAPRYLQIRCERREYRLPLPTYPPPAPPIANTAMGGESLPLPHPCFSDGGGREGGRPLLVNLTAILKRHDPDLLLTAWGDTWLLPYLLELSESAGIPLPLNRDASQPVVHKQERSYQAYGQVIHRGRQVHLFGRWHIDIFNAMMFHDYGLDGILESSRVTALPVQQVARQSPGTGISSMQIVTALRQGVLIPWRKQQAEMPKSALDLIHADQGGLVYQPTIGLHRDVAEIDFVSMYPSIMARFNISPETIGDESDEFAEQAPELNLWVKRETPGLIPQTLRPLLDKRIAFKQRIPELPAWDPRKAVYKARAAAHKWLLVTCFGYLGYKNARFGRIEAHQAVTAYSRECLLRAKEAAEDAGYTVLHLYVDGLWVQKPGCAAVADIQPLLDEIAVRTGLPVALDGIYRWVAFLPSRVNTRVPVANRYFGVFQDGTIKVRGIEARRRDTPPFVAQTQMAILEYLAAASNADQLRERLPEALAYLNRRVRQLRERRVSLPELLVTQKVSRELALYRTPSPAARAALQLQAVGKTVRPGQPVKLLYLLGKPGVHAWDCLPSPCLAQVDTRLYVELLLRAAEAVLQPVGVSKEALRGRQQQALLSSFSTPTGHFLARNINNDIDIIS